MSVGHRIDQLAHLVGFLLFLSYEVPYIQIDGTALMRIALKLGRNPKKVANVRFLTGRNPKTAEVLCRCHSKVE
jgi:hypothetical protein